MGTPAATAAAALSPDAAPPPDACGMDLDATGSGPRGAGPFSHAVRNTNTAIAASATTAVTATRFFVQNVRAGASAPPCPWCEWRRSFDE
jgi:hypothetical protein